MNVKSDANDHLSLQWINRHFYELSNNRIGFHVKNYFHYLVFNILRVSMKGSWQLVVGS